MFQMYILIQVIKLSKISITEQIMNFLINLFTCGRLTNISTKNTNNSSHQTLNHTKKSKKLEKSKENEEQLIIPTLPKISKPITQIPIQSTKLPETQKILLRGYHSSKQRKVDYGFLTGIINESPKSQSLLPRDVFKLNIGKNQQISEIVNLRQNSVDKLVVFWARQVQQYSLDQLIRSGQSLVLVVEEWNSLQTLMKNFEKQLLKMFGDYDLVESSDKLFYHIVAYQNGYIIEFQERCKFNRYTKSMLEKQLSIEITDQQFDLLLSKITLNDYYLLHQKPTLNTAKAKKYLNQIRKQQIASLSKRDLLLTSECDSLSEQEDKDQIRKQSKSSGPEMQALYFASKKKDQPNQQSPTKGQKQSNLEIYLFNATSEQQQSEQVNQQKINAVSTFNRKLRSKSEDIIYIPDSVLELDDEFFSKYS